MDIIAKLQNDKALFATTALFGLIGALYVAAKAFGLLELLFEVFVKQGVSVSWLLNVVERRVVIHNS